MGLSKKEIQVVLANEEDHEKLLNLFIDNYPGLGWSEKYLKWQYYDNPAGTAKSWIARHNGNDQNETN
ncbi:MAG: hypothetical protein IIA45_11095 [Bacteroidetes bacterium]|nr:hypothetical protein [Bacteroidota bacterium]